MEERPIPGQGVLMATEGDASQGAGIPGQCGWVPAGDKVCATEALRSAVELIGGTWASDIEGHVSVPAPLPC
jgi:hypothetical protein